MVAQMKLQSLTQDSTDHQSLKEREVRELMTLTSYEKERDPERCQEDKEYQLRC